MDGLAAVHSLATLHTLAAMLAQLRTMLCKHHIVHLPTLFVLF